MALRDIFDSDPRSKDQLREEIRLHSKVISDLSSQLDELSAASKVSALETENLRLQLESEKLQNSSLHSQQSNLQPAVTSHDAAESIESAAGTSEHATSDSDATLKLAACDVRIPEETQNQGKKLLLQQLSAQLQTIRDRNLRLLVTENEQVKLQLQDLTRKLIAVGAELEESRHTVGWSPAQVRRLEDRERLVFRNFAELMRRENLVVASSSNETALPSVMSFDIANEMLSSLEEISTQRMRLATLIDRYESDSGHLQQELATLRASPEYQRHAVSVETIEKLRRTVSALTKENSILDARYVDAVKSNAFQNGDAERALAERERVLAAREARVVAREAIAPKTGSSARIQQEPDEIEFHRHLKKLISEQGQTLQQRQGEINRLESETSRLRDELEEAAESLLKALRKNEQEEARLGAELARSKLRVELLQRRPGSSTTLNIATFTQEEILTWMFSETNPDELHVDHGYLHLMGDGPWDNDTFGRVMEGQKFSLWKLPDPDIAHLVVGRNNWVEADLLAQIEARQGQSLRIYSQEMWFAAMATGRDPFDADDPDLLQAFANGHEALEFLIGQEMPWPNVSDHPPGDVTDVEAGELGVVASPMHLMDYRVGKTSPHSEVERHAILDEIFCTRNLEFGDDCTPTYRANWGTPKSAQRLYRMASHIKFIVEGPNGSDYRKPVAREDWINDLAWLKKTYFRKTVHAFKWPDTHVP